MRSFYLLSHTFPSPLKPQIDRGIVDEETAEICSCVRAALFLSHDIRRDVQVHLIASDENREIVIDGSKVRYLSPDERSICMLLIKMNEKKSSRRPWRGVTAKPFTSLQDSIPPGTVLVALSGHGRDVRQLKSLKDVSVVVPLYPLSRDEEQSLKQLRAIPVKRRKTLPSHFIVLLNNYLDLLEAQPCTP